MADVPPPYGAPPPGMPPHVDAPYPPAYQAPPPYPAPPYGHPYPAGGYLPPPPQPRRRRPLRIAGLVGAVVVVLAGVGAIVAALRSHGPSVRAADGTIVRAGQIQPVDLRVGDCVRVPAKVPSTTLRVVSVVPCSQLHNGQVYTVVQGSGAYPGDQALKNQALSDCRDAISDFLDSDSTPLHVVVFVPEQAGWAAGRRAEQCLLVDRAKDITGDIRDDH